MTFDRIGHWAWTDMREVGRWLATGTDPSAPAAVAWGVPLIAACRRGSKDVVAALAAQASDVNVRGEDGRTPLWEAVWWANAGAIEALLAAGADPWIEVMCGWSAGRLALAGAQAPLFAGLPEAVPLEEEHRAAVQSARERKKLLSNKAHLGGEWALGMGLALVAGISADEAIQRLGADPARFAPHHPRLAPWPPEDEEDPDDFYTAGLRYVAVTEIAGGCALVQPEGFAVTLNETVKPLSAGTRCVAVYFNAKSGTQSSYVIDGEWVGRDPVDSDACPDEDPARTLNRFLYSWAQSREDPTAAKIGHAFTLLGLDPGDGSCVKGPWSRWVEVPEWSRF
ncbi:DUF6461 domain-containing protein [Nonomuraea sp. NEAU-A123]|uniref:DUF6461 domain-containing protein n=1 Tax=Nonomuraea sp. NEAU-A123 TaxID=2839649 RepID=UPI001BE4C210|nr:DUF6461 domain-containing protein [Nonomuraea sp. NEAU-A123]MBT2233439.1 ankyrin repeat domain-containing protein [Nonomuraea sp. NEAU-A123]